MSGGRGEEGIVTGRGEGDGAPSGGGAGGDGDLALVAGALDAGDLSEGGARGDSHLGDGLVGVEVLGVAHVLIGAVGAVLDAVAAAGVRDHLFVGADEVGLSAGAGGVVARRGLLGDGKLSGGGDHDGVEEEDGEESENRGNENLHFFDFLRIYREVIVFLILEILFCQMIKKEHLKPFGKNVRWKKKKKKQINFRYGT